MSRVTVSYIFLLYSLLGILFLVLRSLLLIYVFLASVILYLIPPIKRCVLRIMCSVLGFFVTYEGIPEGSSDQPYVSNCVTLFDHMGINLITTCVTPYKYMMSWALSWRKLDVEQQNYQKIDEVFHLQPEELPMGNRNHTLLKFNEEPFKLFKKVQPVAISVNVPFGIKLSLNPIDWKQEIFWMLFSPFVHMHIRFLTPITITNNESYGEFAEKCSVIISKALNFERIDYDKIYYLSNKLTEEINKNEKHSSLTAHEQISRDYSSGISSAKESCDNNNYKTNQCSMQIPTVGFVDLKIDDPQLQQIKAVLPDVDLFEAQKYLRELNDVDLAITRLLEKSITSNPTITTQQSHNKTSTTQYLAPCSHRVAACNFGRHSDSRHASLQERKSLFIDNARQRYLQLHPSVNSNRQ